MKHQRYRKTLLASAILASLCILQTGHAQTVPQETSDNTESKEFEVVTITVDQRQVNLQEAALSVTAVRNELLEQANISNAAQLNGFVPGLQINKSGGSETQVSIRGIGSQTPQNFYSQPGVSFHMDGGYITNSIALTMGFLDVEHIEIQRGPQGTAFGAASTGGTINVISKKPVLEEFTGNIDASFGNYNYAKGKIAVNVPVGDSLAVRGVLQTTSHDGFSQSNSIDGGYDLNDADNVNARISALWEASDDLSILISTQHYTDDSNGSALKAQDDPNEDPRVVSQDYPAKIDMTMDISTAIVTWELPWATLKSTTSYQDMDHAQSFDSDRSDFENFGGYDHVATWSTWAETIVQELSLSSKSGGMFDWVIGAFYLKSKSGQYVLEYKGTDINDPTEILPQDLAPEDIPFNVSYENVSHITRTSWAPFLQGTLNINDDLHITAGVRYNDDDYVGLSSSYYAEANSTDFASDNLTGKIAIDYTISPDNMIYASLSKGYKPGGVNSSSANAMVVSTEIQPETLVAYEVGSKNRFLENDLQLNISAFYYKYDDMQYIQEDPIPYAGGTGNIPETNVWGTEIEMSWNLLDDSLKLGLNATAVDGEFIGEYYALDRRAADAAGDEALATGAAPYAWSYEWFLARGSANVDVSGNTPPTLPKLSGSVNATWFQEVGDDALLTTRIDYIYRSEFQSRIFNTPNADTVDSYGQVNLFVEYEQFDANWRLWLNATNLTDELGIAGRFVDPYGSGVVSDEYIAPRQIILNFGYSF